MKRLLYAIILCALAVGIGQSVPRARTAAPTQLPAIAEMVGDLNPASFSESFSANMLLEPAGYWTYFAGSDTTHGTELWRTDGTPEGTTLVADIWPGPESSFPHRFTPSGEKVYFVADDGAHSYELWVSDSSGTELVGDFEPGVRNFAPEVGTLEPGQLTPFEEGGLLFTTDQDTRLWWTRPGETPKMIQAAETHWWIKILTTDPAGGRFFFGRYNQYEAGVEATLWVSDGTSKGTHLVRTYAPVPGGYYAYLDGLMLNGRLVFQLINPASSTEVWSSDGSEAGTQVISASGLYDNIILTPSNGPEQLLFTAGWYRTELWVTDGTVAGTHAVTSFPGDIKNLTEVNGQAVFTISVRDDVTSVYISVLWVSDASPEGTQAIYTFQDNADIGSMVEVNGRAVFTTISSEYIGGNLIFTSTLWATDATPGGTQALYTVEPPYGEGVGIFLSPASDGSRLYYFNQGTDDHDELWITDGTVSGTVLVEQIDSLASLVWASSRVIFTSWIEPVYQSVNLNLGISDGTPGGTGLIKPGQEPQGSSFPHLFTPAGVPNPSRVYFAAEDATHGQELWLSDADGSGAILVKDIYSGTTSSNPLNLTILGDTLFFTADLAGGRALWKSNGTPPGTAYLGEFNYPYELNIFNGMVYFLNFNHMWKTSGGAPEIVYTPGEGTWLSELEQTGNQLYLAQYNGDGYPVTLMVSDGTGSGTTSVRDFGAVVCSKGGCTAATLSELTGADGRLYFAASPNDPAYETDLWTSDGTTQGTLQLSGLYDVDNSSDPSLLTPQGGELVFVEDDGRNGLELWRSDGTPAGTALLSNIYPGFTKSGPASSGPTELTWVGDMLYFAATDPVGGRELWRYQAGVFPAVRRVADIALGAGSTNPSQLAAAGDVLLFAVSDPEAGNELWVSGGSAVTTRQLVDLRSGPDSSNPGEFTVAGEWVLFQANDGVNGVELWRLPVEALSRTPQSEIGPQGGVLRSNLDGVSYSFGTGTFGGLATVRHGVEAAAPVLPSEGWLVEMFESSGTQAPTQPYTLTVEYMDYQIGPAIESSLRLVRWDGSTWVEESFSLDMDAGTITAHPSGWGVFAAIGETRSIFLPVIW